MAQRLHTFRTAPARATPVLLLTGALELPEDWRGLSDWLGPAYRPQVFDVCETPVFGAEQAHIVATGTAALPALWAALAFPASVLSLTLIDPDDCAEDGNTDARAADRTFERFLDEGDAYSAMRTLIDHRHGPGTWARTAHGHQQKLARRAGGYRQHARVLRRSRTAPAALGRLACPVTMLTGTNAPARIKDTIERLDAHLALANTRLFPGSGLNAHLHNPHTVLPEIRDFLVRSDLGWQDVVQIACKAA